MSKIKKVNDVITITGLTDPLVETINTNITRLAELSGITNEIQPTNNESKFVFDKVLESTKGFSTSLTNGHTWMTGGDELYAIDVLEGTAWAVGGFSATLDQSQTIYQTKSGIIDPLKRNMQVFEEYPILIDDAHATVSLGGSVASGYAEITRTNRAWFGFKFKTAESLSDEKLEVFVYYGTDSTTGELFADSSHLTETYTANSGDDVSIWLMPPLETDPNVAVFYEVRKENGSVLNVRPTNEDITKPYWCHLMRQFDDQAQLYLPVYHENVPYTTNSMIWRYNNILVGHAPLRENSITPRPFDLSEWVDIGSKARFELSNAPTVDFSNLDSYSSLDNTVVLQGDFKISFRYSGSGGANSFYLDDGIKNGLSRIQTQNQWRILIDGAWSIIYNPARPAIGDELMFTRTGAVFEGFINGVSLGATSCSLGPFKINTVGNTGSHSSLIRACGQIHDVMIVNRFGQLAAWWPMQENGGPIMYDVIGNNNGTYNNVTWATQSASNHARNYGVRIEGPVYIPARPAGIVGAESATGEPMTHYPIYGDNGCGIGEINSVGVEIELDFSVGSPVTPSEFNSGEGSSYTQGMFVYQYDATGDAFIDVTSKARSADTSSFGFFSNTMHDSIYITSDMKNKDTEEYHKFFGLEISTATAMELSTGVVILEYWNGTAWVNMAASTTQGDSPYYPSSMVDAFSTVGTYQIRWDDDMDVDWTTKNNAHVDGDVPIIGDDSPRYWARLRIATPVATLPTFEQFRLHTNSTKFNSDGWQEFFGKARPVGKLPINVSALRAFDGAMGADTVWFDEDMGMYNADGVFNSIGDATGTIFELPVDTDVSCAMRVRMGFQPLTTGTHGFDVHITRIQNGDTLYESNPLTPSANRQTIHIDPVFTTNTNGVVEVKFDISNYITRRLAGFGDQVAIAIASTTGEDALLIGISIDTVKWCTGGHL